MVAEARRAVLLVEDEPVVREIICSVLEANEFAVTPVGDLDTALAHLGDAADRFDWVLSDVRLGGGGNGIELADWICEHQPHITVVLMSALSEATHSSHHFLPKPFTEQELVEALTAARALTLSSSGAL
ncbi:MAG: response regulator [Pseudomonadota bacterium]